METTVYAVWRQHEIENYRAHVAELPAGHRMTYLVKEHKKGTKKERILTLCDVPDCPICRGALAALTWGNETELAELQRAQPG